MMSTLTSHTHIEGLVSALYTLISSMLSSKNSVKCVSQHGCEIFTTDAEQLLSNLDIEHTGSELIIQALRSHKCLKTETNTLLFMITRLAMAVAQLQDLGILSQDTLRIMRDAVGKLSEKVEDISIPVIINERETVISQLLASVPALDSTSKLGFTINKKGEWTENEGHILPTSTQPSEETNLTVCDKFLTENTILGSGDTPACIGQRHQAALVSQEKEFSEPDVLPVNSQDTVSLSGISLDQQIPIYSDKSSEAKLRSLKTKATVRKSEHLVRSGVLSIDAENQDLSNGPNSSLPFSFLEKIAFNENNGNQEDKLCKNGVWQFTESAVAADSEPVYLRMLNKQDQVDLALDDIGWFFETTTTVPSETISSSREFSLDDATHNVKDIKINEETVFLNDGFCNQQLEKKTVLGCKNSETAHDSDQIVLSCKDNDQFDSDFEDCFDDVENRKHSTVLIEPLPPSVIVPFHETTLFMNIMQDKISGSSVNNGEAAMLHNIKQHGFNDGDFEEVTVPLQLDFESPDQDDDEFDSCFSSNLTFHPKETDGTERLVHYKIHRHGENNDNDQVSLCSEEFIDDFTKLPWVGDLSVIQKCTKNSTTRPIENTTEKSTETQFLVDKKPAKYLSQSSEIEKLNSMLNAIGAKSSGRNHSVLSRHFQDPESYHPSSELLSSGEQKFTQSNFSLKDFDHKSPYHCFVNTLHSVGYKNIGFQPDPFHNFSSKHKFDQSPPSGDSSSGCEQLEKCETVGLCNIPQITSSKKNSQMDARDLFICPDMKAGSKTSENLSKKLDSMLLKKKNQLKSSTAAKVVLSSRHLCGMGKQTLSGVSEEQEISSNKSHGNVPVTDLEDHNRSFIEPEHVKPPSLTKDLNQVTSHLKNMILGGSVSTSQSGAVAQQDKAAPNSAQANFLALTLPEGIRCFDDCCGEMMNVARHVFTTQLKKTGEKSFNLNLVDCVLSSLAQSQSSRTIGASTSVVPGLVIPCGSSTLEQMQPLMEEDSRNAMLVNGDVTSTFHHKGYKPTLAKRNFVYEGQQESKNYDERAWAASIVLFLEKLNVDMLLVKGKASEIFSDMCLQAGILLLTNVSYNAIRVLSDLHRVDILTYITNATQASVCRLLIHPVSKTWMDQYELTKSSHQHFIAVVNASIVQTVLITNLSEMSAQLQEEKLWQYLHALANATADGKVLPGGGNTEAWCAQVVQDMKEASIVNQSSMESVILDALADVFHDYVALSKVNSQVSRTNETQNKRNIFQTECASRLSGHHKHVSDSARFPSSWSRTSVVESAINLTGNETNSYVSSEDVKQSKSFRYSQDDSNPAKCLTRQSHFSHSHLTKELTQTNNNQPVSDAPCQVQHTDFVNLCECNNFRAKISAWETAVDVVSVLMNLDSLIISGVDKTDMEWDVVL